MKFIVTVSQGSITSTQEVEAETARKAVNKAKALVGIKGKAKSFVSIA